MTVGKDDATNMTFKHWKSQNGPLEQPEKNEHDAEAAFRTLMENNAMAPPPVNAKVKRGPKTKKMAANKEFGHLFK